MKRILLVDDQAHVLRVIKLSLDRSGFEVDTALSSDTALLMYRENPYDVIIVDNHLSGVGVKELHQALRREHPQLEALILIVSDADELEHIHWVDNAQSVEVVAKPMSLRWLVARLNQYFGRFGDGDPLLEQTNAAGIGGNAASV